eukprot:GILI01003739.1.p1 GENE.GILI01003739.1~~GILI01003739.1.p1  ORF type:complete len:498 (-),score=132.07 GILI01003739.1:274-1767(-)
MDYFLLAITIILSVVLLIINLYILAYFQHEEDRGMNGSIFCKFLVIFGLTLAWAQVLVLPLDVANSRGLGGGLRVDILWQVIYIAIAIMIVALIPFSIYYYEGDEEDSMGKRICTAIKYELVTGGIVCAIFAIMFVFLGYSEIPVPVIACGAYDMVASDNVSTTTFACKKSSIDLLIPVSFPVYVMAFISFVGWFLFIAFGGIGLSALPMDLIRDFLGRPKRMDLNKFAEKKKEVGLRAQMLLEAGAALEKEKQVADLASGWDKRKKTNKYRTSYNRWQQMVFLLEKEWEILDVSFHQLGGNPLIPWAKLLLGIIGSCLSVIWVLHILLYMLIAKDGVPLFPFLNYFLLGLEASGFALFSTIGFTILCLWLLWCTMKGNMKFGMRFFLCCPIHPMKRGETLMNSFLFNVQLILLSTTSIVQFCAMAFSEYTRLSDADLLFSTQVKYLRFFRYFWQMNVFLYIFLAWAFLTFFYLLIKPVDKPADLDKLIKSRPMSRV